MTPSVELREAARRLLRLADELEMAERTRALAQSGAEFTDYAVVTVLHEPQEEIVAHVVRLAAGPNG